LRRRPPQAFHRRMHGSDQGAMVSVIQRAVSFCWRRRRQQRSRIGSTMLSSSQ
jgi:hypothetical protein